MSDKDHKEEQKSLIPIEERTVGFYDDEILVVVVEERDVYVPIRPMCEFLGVNYRSQRRRIDRDPVLSKYIREVTISTAGGPQAAPSLMLDYLNGWLFGISAASVKEEVRERVILYQEKCYLVLRDAFQQSRSSSATSTLVQVREMGRAIMQMAEEQMEFERRLNVNESRIDKAANIVGDLSKRVALVEQRLAPGDVVTNEQASQISQAVKAVAIALGKQTQKNEFGAVYGELYRQFGITSYKLLPTRRFEEAITFLTDWHQQLVGESPF